MGNIQTYQLQMIDSVGWGGFGGGGVNYQMQIVTTKLPKMKISKLTNYK